MNKHTPGMFKALMLHGEGRSIPVVMADGTDQVAIIADGTWDDARLFAAAPDLLAALEMVADLPGFAARDYYGVKVLEAIARARGEA